MTYYIKRGSTYNVSKQEALDIHDHLPAGNYTVALDINDNFYLESVNKFQINHKIYGDFLKKANRILTTFKERSGSTGVLLAGAKGSGKTLLAKLLSVTAYESNIPTIVINQAWHGERFNNFIQSITQPVIILFDEFEKVYGDDEQESMLTLLDGVYPSNKLFILTCNNMWRVNAHMRNRPGRIFYSLEYKGVGPEFIREFCLENLHDKSHVEKIVIFSGTFGEFNFDMLKALVEEMNRYNESPQEAVQMLNAKPEYGDTKQLFNVKLFNDNVELVVVDKTINVRPTNDRFEIGYCDRQLHENTKILSRNPSKPSTLDSLTNGIGLEVQTIEVDRSDEDQDIHYIGFLPSHLVKIEQNGMKYIFVNKNYRLELTQHIPTVYNYWDAI